VPEDQETRGAITKPPRADDDLSVDGGVDAGPLGNWRIRAAGLYGGTVIASVAFGSILIKGAPQTNPQHFILAVVAAGVLGAFLHACATKAHIRSLTERIQDFRGECHRMAKRNEELEKLVVNVRLSSNSKKKRR
jgi:hypothetical protein